MGEGQDRKQGVAAVVVCVDLQMVGLQLLYPWRWPFLVRVLKGTE